MKFKVSNDLWIVVALFLFTLVIAYVSSLQSAECLDPTQKPGIWELTAWPIKVALFQLLAAFGLLAFTLSRRFINPVPFVEPSRTQGEYVASMAQLLQKAEKRSLIVQTLSQQFRQELARKMGLPPATSQEELVKVLKIHHPTIASRVENIFTQADVFQYSGKERDVIGMIRWGREIAAVRQEWRRGR
ncbi:hypothetical protein HY229_06960 [Candidatus Acetothermia bacterium]|nr:hypothetical protein [Candidatus Acetothermia bacterium]MBI3643824.1 hypothetical protein [Candidatus Acetothermia bacterium]